MGKPVVVVHGGGWAIPDDEAEAHLLGVRAAVRVAARILERGGSALDACEAAVACMEDDEAFDAGRGSFLTSDGRAQLDAMIMEGHTLRAGGVGCVERLRNPICAARKVLEESPHVYLVGSGAEDFALAHGIPLCENQDLVTPREIERLRRAQAEARFVQPPEFSARQSHDTVGAAALDRQGNLAAATSTGGMLNKTPGRIGDSSLIGCGVYADNESAAVSTTGWGEPMMKLVLGKWAVDRVRAGSAPQQAAEDALAYLRRRLNGHGGIILLDPAGRIGVAHNTPRMAWAFHKDGTEQAGIDRPPSLG